MPVDLIQAACTSVGLGKEKKMAVKKINRDNRYGRP
jgi:hypothetical protein